MVSETQLEEARHGFLVLSRGPQVEPTLVWISPMVAVDKEGQLTAKLCFSIAATKLDACRKRRSTRVGKLAVAVAYVFVISVTMRRCQRLNDEVLRCLQPVNGLLCA